MMQVLLRRGYGKHFWSGVRIVCEASKFELLEDHCALNICAFDLTVKGHAVR